MLKNEQNLCFIKLDHKIMVSNEKGVINKDFSMDFSIQIENNIIIDLFEIITKISKNDYQNNNKNFQIYKENENYIIKNKELNTEYKLDNLLIHFFEKMEKKLFITYNNHINKLILIYDIISYEIRLIIQQSALINGIDIIHMIDTNKALRFYIELSETIQKHSKTQYISIIIKYSNYIEIATYTCGPIRKLYNTFKEIPNVFEDLKEVKYTKDSFILLDDYNENKLFIKLKKYISDLIEFDMGNQDFQNLEQIYIFDAKDQIYLNDKTFLGTSISLKSKRTQQCIAIFNVIDKNDQTEKKITNILIGKYQYNIEKREIPFLLDLELPFEGCFYMTINITLYNKTYNDNALITIYFNQINYFYISLCTNYCNSIEFIFYKKFPEISFDSQEYKKIEYNEKFEDNEHFKRICLLNVNREKIKANLISEEYQEILVSNIDDDDYKNLTVIVGEDLKILSFFKKQKFSKKNFNIDIYKDIEFADKLNSKLSLKELELYKSNLSNMYFQVKCHKYYFKKFFRNEYSVIDNIVPLMMAYGKFLIFTTIFIEETEKGTKISYNESNFKKFINIMEQLEKFHEKCKNYIKKDDLMIAKLFLTASFALTDYLNSNEYSDLRKDLIELVDFKEKGTVYNSSYENNIEFILNLNKNSFLYPILLQFNSGFKIFEYQDREIPSYMVSKLTLQQIKLDLIKSLDHYGIRIFFQTIYLGDTTLITGITIYNEKKLFGKMLNQEELLTLNDINYHKRAIISFLQKHERFSHLNKIFNKNESNYVDSPRGYIDFFANQFKILSSKDNIDKGKIGEVLEYFLSSGNRQLIDNLYHNKGDSFNFKKLFNIDLLLDKSNEKLINILKTIPKVIVETEDNKYDDKSDNYINNHNRKYKTLQKIENKNNNKEKNNIDKYIEAKNRMINENTFRKFTFERNTICCYKIDFINNKLILDE